MPAPKPKVRKCPRRFAHRRNPEYAAWIRQQPCILLGQSRRVWLPEGLIHWCSGQVQACHVRARGAAGDDAGNLWPACGALHAEQHAVGLKTFQRRWGLDLQAIAADFWARYQREQG